MQGSGCPIFYINLDRVPERQRHMQAALREVGLADRAERFPAVDARDPDALRDTGYAPGRWRERWSLTPTLIACFESHRALWRRIAEEQHPLALIMEDDVFLSARLKDTLAALEQAAPAFDVIRLDTCHGHYRFGPPLRAGGLHLRPILQVVPSAACYVLSRSGARKLVARSQVYCDHVDDFLFTPRRGWRMLQSWPAVAVQGMFAQVGAGAGAEAGDALAQVSRSERLSVPSEHAPPDKGPVAYRLMKEFRRSLRKAGRKLGGDARLRARGGIIGCPPTADDLPDLRS